MKSTSQLVLFQTPAASPKSPKAKRFYLPFVSMFLRVLTLAVLLSVATLSTATLSVANEHDSFARSTQDTAPTLRWKFNQGEQYVFDFDQTIRLEKDVAGIKTTQSTSQRSQVLWKVLQVADTSAEVEMRYTRIDFELETPDGLIKTSTDPSFPKVANGKVGRLATGLVEAVSPIIDQPFIIKLSNRGELLEVKMDAKIVDQIRKAPNSMAIRNTVSQEGIKEILSSLLVPFPETATAKWESESQVVVAGVPVSRICKYEINDKAEVENLQEITFLSKIDFPENFIIGETAPSDKLNQTDSDPTRPNGANSPFDFDPTSKKWPRIARQEADGSLTFNLEEGYAVRGNSTSLLATEKAYSNVLIKTTIVTQTSVEVTKK